MPNYSALPEFHYKNVFETDHNTADGVPRKNDDFLPRPNIVEHFEKGLLTVDNEEEIEKFSNTFIVEKEYIKEYLQHIINLKRSKEIRENERSINKMKLIEKHYKDYDWTLLTSLKERMNKLRVFELDKYLNYYHLSKEGKKVTKLLA